MTNNTPSSEESRNKISGSEISENGKVHLAQYYLVIYAYGFKGFDEEHGTRIERVKNVLCQYPDWLPLTETTFAVVAEESAQDLFEKLRSIVLPGESLFIMHLPTMLTGQLSKHFEDWLRRNSMES
jgi:hypothetical protein